MGVGREGQKGPKAAIQNFTIFSLLEISLATLGKIHYWLPWKNPSDAHGGLSYFARQIQP